MHESVRILAGRQFRKGSKILNKVFKTLVLLLVLAACSFANWMGGTSVPDSLLVDGVKYYQIGSPEELAWFAHEVNDGNSNINAQLTQDIVLWEDSLSEDSEATKWIPIGWNEKLFGGIFDGANHKISGLYINEPNLGTSNLNYYGLFGCANTQSVIKNLKIENVYIQTDGYRHDLGGIAGLNLGNIQNVSVQGTIKTHAYNSTVGGIVGESYGTISAAQVDGYVGCVSASNCDVGGIVGLSGATIENATNNAHVSGSRTGGIVGFFSIQNSSDTIRIDSCVNNGDIESVSDNPSVGGLVGASFAKLRVRKSVNNGSLESSGKEVFAGGIIGFADAPTTIDSSTNNGSVSVHASSLANVGGISGLSYVLSLDSIQNNGDVYVVGADSLVVGGIAGNMIASKKVELAENTGDVKVDSANGSVYLGGFSGIAYSGTEIKNSKNSGSLILLSANGNAYVGGATGYLRDGSLVTGFTNSGKMNAISNHTLYIGGVVGSAYSGIKITDCINEGHVTADALSSYVGGIIGEAIDVYDTFQIESCINKGDLEVLNDTVSVCMGGIASWIAGSVSMHKCENEGNLNFDTKSATMGGIVGENSGSFTADSCINNGNVTGKVSGYLFCVGGIGGLMNTEIKFSYVQNNGNLHVEGIEAPENSSVYAYVGGICGLAYNARDIHRVNNTGSVDLSISGDEGVVYSGGLGGYMPNASIRECANTGRVSVSASDSRAFIYTGGLVGFLPSSNVTDCYNSANVDVSGKSGVKVGGIAGFQGGGTLKNIYSLADTIIATSEKADSLYKGTLVGEYAGTLNGVYSLDIGDEMEYVGIDHGSYKKVGSLSADEMRSDRFAWLLNTTSGADSNSRTWSRLDGFPVFADESHLPIYHVIFEMEDSVRYSNDKGEILFPDMSNYEGKEFSSWVDEKGQVFIAGTKIEEDLKLSPVFEEDLSNRFWVTFAAEDSSKFQTYLTDAEGMVYIPGDPVPSKDRVFSGWFDSDKNFVTDSTVFTKNDTVSAVYDFTYSITFKNADGSVLDKIAVYPGDYPNYGGRIPWLPTTAKYEYYFKDWTPEIKHATSDEVYTAVFDSTLCYYHVEFVSNGNVIKSQYIQYGKPATPPETPAMNGYTFSHWDVPFDSITEDLVVTAVFEASKMYFIAFHDNNRVVWAKDMDENSIVVFPTLSDKVGYVFTGWYDENGTYLGMGGDSISVKRDIDIYAMYLARTYKISFVYKEHGEEKIYTEFLSYGSLVNAPKIANADSSARYRYAFSQWEPQLQKVEGDMVYEAQYVSSARRYEVLFLDIYGVPISAQEVYYDSAATAPEAPKYEGYRFIGWDKPFNKVESNLKISALYEKMDSHRVAKSSSSQGGSAGSSSSIKPFHIEGEEAVAGKALVPQFSIEIVGRRAQIGAARVGSPFAVMDIQGRALSYGYVSAANFDVALPHAGTFLVRVGNQTQRVTVK